MTKTRRAISTALLSMAALTVAAPAAMAAAPSSPADGSAELRPAYTKAQYVAATKRFIKYGKSKDRKIIKTNRSLAKTVSDGWWTSRHGSTKVTSSSGGKTCFKADYYWDYNTVLGSNAFQWHGILAYCIKKGKVVSAKPSERINFQNSFNSRGAALQVYGKTALKKKTFSITLQGEVKNEILWGTVATHHPTISYKVSGKTGSVKVGGHD